MSDRHIRANNCRAAANKRRESAGYILVLCAISITAIAIMMALAVDIFFFATARLQMINVAQYRALTSVHAYQYWKNEQGHNLTASPPSASLLSYSDPVTKVRIAGLIGTDINSVRSSDSVTYGNYSGGTYTADATPINASRVTLTIGSGSVLISFAKILGLSQSPLLKVGAVAYYDSGTYPFYFVVPDTGTL